MGSCRYSSTVLKVAAVFVFIVFVLHTVGTFTPHWSSVEAGVLAGYETFDSGLWQICFCNDHVDCTCAGRSFSNDTDWFKATQALTIIGFIALLFSMVITFVLLCIKQKRSLKILNICILAFAGVCILIAVIIFGVKMDDAMGAILNFKFDYSFILCIVAVVLLFLVCLPLLIYDWCYTPRRYRDDRVRYSTRKREIFVEPEQRIERYVPPPEPVRKQEIYIQPEERYAPAPAYGGHPVYSYYDMPSYEPVRYERQPEYAPVQPAYADYRSSRPMYVDYRSSRPDYSSSRALDYSYRR